MTDEEIQIEIAKAVGWEWHNTQAGGCYVSPDKSRTARRWQDLPNYPNDLNAMASAETYAQKDLMNADQWENYGRLLYKAHPTAVITDSSGVLDFYAIAELMTGVTARQRAEAFLRTIGKWKN